MFAEDQRPLGDELTTDRAQQMNFSTPTRRIRDSYQIGRRRSGRAAATRSLSLCWSRICVRSPGISLESDRFFQSYLVGFLFSIAIRWAACSS